MKILYLSKAILPSEISNSLSIMRMCQAFADAGHEVVLTGIAPYKGAPDPIKYYGLRGGFEIVRYKLAHFWYNPVAHRLFLPGFLLALNTRRMPSYLKPDIIYSRLTLAELALLPRNIPIIYEMHSLGWLGRSLRERVFFKWLIRSKNVVRFIVTTDYLADRLQSEFSGVDVRVARLSAELPVEIYENELASFKKNQLQGQNFKHHVGYTGQLDTKGIRGTEIIIQAAARMPEIAFHIVGGNPGTMKYWVEKSNSNVNHGNLFFYGHRNPSEMPFFLGCFDVVLAPLQFRPNQRAPMGRGMSPLKVAQYMSYAKAIIASDIPAHNEILQHGQTAMLVNASAVEEWIVAINFLVNNPQTRKELGDRARKEFFQNFTPGMRVERILEGL